MNITKVVLVCTIWSLLIVPNQSGLAQDENESFLQDSLKAGEFLKEIYEKGHRRFSPRNFFLVLITMSKKR
jgi:hypothetical protein